MPTLQSKKTRHEEETTAITYKVQLSEADIWLSGLCWSISKEKNKEKNIFTFSPFTPLQSHLDKEVHPWQAFKDTRKTLHKHKAIINF